MTPPCYVDVENGICRRIELGIDKKIAGSICKSPALKPLEIDLIKTKLGQYIQNDIIRNLCLRQGLQA